MRKRRLGGGPDDYQPPQSQPVPVPVSEQGAFDSAAGGVSAARVNYNTFKGESSNQFGELGVIMVSYFIALCIFFVDSSSIKSTYTYVLSLTFVSITMSTSLYSGIISSAGVRGGTAISKIILVTGGISFLTWCYFSYRLYDDMSTLRTYAPKSGNDDEDES